MSKKIIFVIPGFGQSAKDKDYLKFKKNLQSFYDKVVVVDVKWKGRVMTHYVSQTRKEIEKYSEYRVVDVLGFSYGAMAAFILANTFPFRNIFICSLSPYFKEHMGNLTNRQIRFLKSKRRADFESYSYFKLSQN
jgi:pimeloyl-ACP methyl ester carboxylesterase